MPVLIKDRHRLRELRVMLKCGDENPHKIPVIGALWSTLVNTYPFEGVVDSWPNFQHVIMRPSLEARRLKFTVNRWFVYCEDPKSFATFIQTPGVADWAVRMEFIAIQPELKDAIVEVSKRFTGTVSPTGEGIWVLGYDSSGHFVSEDKIAELLKKLPQGFTLGSLRPEHAGIILQNWDYLKQKTEEEKSGIEEQMKHAISRHISVCVFNEHGQPVSWNMKKYDSSSGMAHTLDEYRKLGLFTLIAAEMKRRVAQSCDRDYGYANMENRNVRHVMEEKMGGVTREVLFLRYEPLSSKV